MQRRVFLHSAATLAASAVTAITAVAGVKAAQAQGRSSAGFPLKPIRLVIAFPAGSPTDALVRILAGNAAAILGQPVRVDNLPGEGGSLPLAQLQAAAPDGYTLAQLPVSVFMPPSSKGKRHANLRDQLVPVIHLSGYALGLSLTPDSPLMDWHHLGDWARAYLGKLVDGPGSAPPARKSLGLGVIQNEPLGIVALRGTPPAVVKRLHDAFKQAMAQPNFKRSVA